MNNNDSNIAIIEPSHIIYEGLSSILHNSTSTYKIIRVSGLEDINNTEFSKLKVNIIIVNPLYVQNNIKEFKKLKKTHADLHWIGLIYNYYGNDVISLFDTVIAITDLSEDIHKNIEQLINKKQNHITESPEDQLSEREIDVLIQLVNGLSNKEIADKLNISIHTVISHRKNISLKTGIKSQSGLTIYAITKNIISIDSISS